ncbi:MULTISPECIES: CoA-transferase [unclassified Pseudonocardia]|uniref:acyl CoA:acetate/3-ketoacid CoA transferase n=1 Tax=unclassified Pseudonocardia TaxID=2619320 RepID=UPI0001FFE5D7|nr:CoA-transferase [Pseudonocardia sp. Ae707_Ps1]OLM20388.1 Acetyl-CoA:acetoacetyl-CoA transferase, alpha subunit [Pseudonocardia sp. Ae707_Ps1]
MKQVTALEAVSTIPSGATLVIGGSGGGHAVPEALLEALEERYLTAAEPRDLTSVHPVGIGDKESRGAHRLRHKGLLRRVVCGTTVDAPGIGEAAARGELELFTVPQGSLSQLMRDSAARRPGLFTDVGVGTYVDPRLGGGRQGAPATDPPSEAVEIDGKPYIRYRPVAPDIALLRGSTVDELGNVSMEDEAYFGEMLSMAQATRNNGGRVIVQVARVVPAGTTPPKSVKIPYFLVDDAVVVPDQPTTYSAPDNRAFAGAERIDLTELPPLPTGSRGLIARRAARELTPGAVCNLGSGISTGVSIAAAETGVLDSVVLTNEQGLNGGLPMSGLDAGAAVNYDAMLDQPYQFDFYDGGGLDIAFLSFAEVSPRGDVNISRFGGRIVGVGGFVNISQGASTVVFSGTLTAGGLDVRWDRAAGALTIVQEGRAQRFVETVEQISFSGPLAQRRGQRIVFVTERCVFELGTGGLVLTEIAPGVDIERDVAPQVGFALTVADDLRTMDPALFDASF